jgi:signal transduction histidine kinase
MADGDIEPDEVLFVLVTEALEEAGRQGGVEGSVEAEVRREVAREVHDRIGGSIFVAMRQLELYQLVADTNPEIAALRIEAVRAALVQLSKDTRELVTDLRERDRPGSLEAELRAFVDAVAPSGVTVRVVVSGSEDLLVPRLRDELFLIVQECLRNSLAHATAQEISVTVDISKTQIVARVTDDGRGFDSVAAAAPGRGNGLAGIRERVAGLHGVDHISSRPAAGTRVEVAIPLRHAEAS